MRRIIALLTAVSAVTFAAGGAGGSESADVRSAPFAFAETYLRNSSFGEPSIALSAKDHVFICGPLGVPGGQNAFLRSDDWNTFTRTTIFDRGGGGDCDVKVGPDGAVYTASLQLWASAVRKSIDDGKTFDHQQTEDAVEQDRQWLAPDPVDPNIVYMAYHDLAAGAIIVAKSIDGARTFPLHFVASTDLELAADASRATIPGPLRIDPNDHNRLYLVWTQSSVEACAAGCAGRRPHRLVVGRSDDGGVTWTNHVAMEARADAFLGALIPWMSLDEAGNVYVTAAGYLTDTAGARTNGLFLAASTDRGQTWSGPVKVNASTAATAFPTIVGGANGIVDLAWIESTKADHGDASGSWTVRFAQSRDATSSTPSFTEIAGPVIHHGAVCMEGLLCVTGGDRSLLDFMDMTLDSFGYAHMVVAANAVGGLRVLWWRQDAGPSATGEPCAPDCVSARPGPTP